MIPGVTLGPRQAGPVAAGLTAAAAAKTADAGASAPFGEFVAWLAQGVASPEAAPLAGRGRAVGRGAEEVSAATESGADSGAETAPAVTAPVEIVLASHVVIPMATPSAAGLLSRDEASQPGHDPSAGPTSAVAAAPIGDSSGADRATLVSPLTVDHEHTLVLAAAGAPVSPDPATAASGQAEGLGTHRQAVPPAPTPGTAAGGPPPTGERPAAAAAAPPVGGATITESGSARGETSPAGEPRRPGIASQGSVASGVPAGGVVGTVATPVPSPEPGPTGTKAINGPSEHTTGAPVGPTSGATGGAAPGDALPEAPRPAAERPSHQPVAETAVAASLRLRRGLLTAAVTPAASPLGTPVVVPGGEAVVTSSPRGADGSSSAGRARDIQAGVDGVPGRRELDLLMPATGVAAMPEPRDGGRAPLQLAATSAAQDGASLDEVLPSQIIRSIRLQWQAGQGEARVQLRPDHLGELSVVVKVDHGAVTATLHAESPDVRRWLESHSGSLRDALAEQGLRLDRLTVADEHGRQDAPDAERRDRPAGEDGDAPSRRRRGRPAEPGSTFDVPTFDFPERTPA